MSRCSIYILFLVLVVSGCDLFEGEQIKITGRISVVNPQNQYDSLYSLIYADSLYNTNVIEDNVVNLIGDDSIMIVEGKSRISRNSVFYKIHHMLGKKPYTVDTISKDDFRDLGKKIIAKYQFDIELK